jgi:outer membrane protein assembly factor BamE (lipoprotein component of BamABCDE complex)
MRNSKIILCGVVLVMAGTISACTPTKAVRGNLVEDYRLENVKPGTSTQADVARALGSPTTQDPFDPTVWYYIGQKTEKKGIFDAKVVEERIIRAKFDGTTGILTEIAPLDTKRNDIPLEAKKTPTSGHEITVIQQMIGNLGKFNKPAQSSNP